MEKQEKITFKRSERFRGREGWRICEIGRTDIITVSATLIMQIYCNEIVVPHIVRFKHKQRNGMVLQQANACPHVARHTRVQTFDCHPHPYVTWPEMTSITWINWKHYIRKTMNKLINKMRQCCAAVLEHEYHTEVLIIVWRIYTHIYTYTYTHIIIIAVFSLFSN